MEKMHFLRGFLVCSLICAAQGQKEVTVKLGEDVILQCQSRKSEMVQMLKWIRPDLKSEGYVYFYRNKRFYENYQHPSFRGRVELRDPEMKDGDASVILKNVSVNDTGTYECYVSGRRRAHSENPPPSITLTVTHSGLTHGGVGGGQTEVREDTDGSVHVVHTVSIVVSVVAGIVGLAAVIIICRTIKGHLKHRKVPIMCPTD